MAFGFSQGLFYFLIYSTLGWVCETVYCSIPAKKFINRGFLGGPYCPVYGVGAVVILNATLPIARYPLLVFLVSLLTATVLEYFTGWLMETLFQTRWWDYSGRRFQIKGRVCLRNSLLFGLMGLGTTYLLHPFVLWLTAPLSSSIRRVITSIWIVFFILDLLHTLNGLQKLNERLQGLQQQLAENRALRQGDFSESLDRLRERLQAAKDEASQRTLQSLERLSAKRHEESRLVRAFPGMRPHGFEDAMDALRKDWERRKEAFWSRIGQAAKSLGRKTLTKTKETASAFAAGISFYKLVWVFVVAGVLGYLVETAFCLVTTGVVESRQGMLYGPFNQVYGFGAVLMVVILTPLAKKNDRWLFAGSALLGGAFEYLCSLIQETFFGSVSWEYGEEIFSFHGRTSLTFMFFWGILGLVFIKGIYPKLSDIIERIPARQGVFISWVLILSLTVNMLLSALAVYRWSQRQQGLEPSGSVQTFIDREYPDEVMEEIYPNMIFLVEES